MFSPKVHEGRPSPVGSLLWTQVRFRWVDLSVLQLQTDALLCCTVLCSPVCLLWRKLHLKRTWRQWWACSTRSSRTTRRWRLVSVRLCSNWRQHHSSPSPSRWRLVDPVTRSCPFKQQCLVVSHLSRASQRSCVTRLTKVRSICPKTREWCCF